MPAPIADRRGTPGGDRSTTRLPRWQASPRRCRTPSSCAQGIEKKLRGFAATADIVVSLEKKLVAVATKEGQDIADEELRRALTDAGYTVKVIRREDESIDAVRARLKASR